VRRRFDGMFERFTERARKVVVLAQDEARRFHHNYVGTEHILLGLVREGKGVAAQALTSLGVTLERVREQVESIVGYGEGTSREIPFTPRSKKVLELGLREAMRLGHNYIGTEHLLPESSPTWNSPLAESAVRSCGGSVGSRKRIPWK
jgi:ATP-dependent Clp protease ATP-binding subunit ClpC